jgi:hypothetical protein
MTTATAPTTWSPSRMPKLRDSLYRVLTTPSSRLNQSYAQDEPYLQHMGRLTGVAELFWVAPDMAALAIGSAETLPWVRWTAADRPSPTGLIVFDGGIGAIDFARSAIGVDAEIPVDAFLWGPHPQGMQVSMFTARWRVDQALSAGAQADPAEVPSLIPIGGLIVDTDPDQTPIAELQRRSGGLATPLATLFASWVLMQQTKVVDRVRATIDRKISRAYRHSGRPDPEVTLVALRHQYQTTSASDTDTDRQYRHRWIVNGHWRDQPYGPGRALRRPQWIPSYVKGPDGAPLLATTRVNVWRR